MPESAGARAAPDTALELFVYYRVAPARAGETSAAVHTMQAMLTSAHPGLQARLLRRPEVSQDRLTFMEVYAQPLAAGGVDTRLRAEIEAAATVLAPWIDGARHTEVFEPCA